MTRDKKVAGERGETTPLCSDDTRVEMRSQLREYHIQSAVIQSAHAWQVTHGKSRNKEDI